MAELEQAGHLVPCHECAAVGGGHDHLELFRGDVLDQEAVRFFRLWCLASFLAERVPGMHATSVSGPLFSMHCAQASESQVLGSGIALARVRDRHHPHDRRDGPCAVVVGVNLVAFDAAPDP